MLTAEYKMKDNPKISKVDAWLHSYSEDDQAYIGTIVRSGNVADFYRHLKTKGEEPCSLSRFRERLKEIYNC